MPSADRYGRRSFDPVDSAGGGSGVTIAHSRSVEERRRVTALFADVSGFTSLAGRLETEELLAVVDPVIAGLAGIVDRYGGYLEKFAGDALLALFGAPVAHEDDAVRALRVAAEMHASIAELSTSPEASGLSLHVGVNTGVVVARSIEASGRAQYAVLGESVILAQRLESLAPPGQTYVGRLTMEQAAEVFDFEDLGPREVKGRADPVEVYRVTGRRADAPARATRKLIGREDVDARDPSRIVLKAHLSRAISIQRPPTGPRFRNGLVASSSPRNASSDGSVEA